MRQRVKRGVIMAGVVKIYRFKDGKAMSEDIIAYANGEYVLLSDYDKVVDELESSKSYIIQLKHDAKEMKEKIAELESELEVKDNLLIIKNGLSGNDVELPCEPISVAEMLINAKEEYEPTSLQKALFKTEGKCLADKYSDDDLEQIAEHLLVYCKHNREDEE